MRLVGAREQVIILRKRLPWATLQTIGDLTGVSRERVRQILDAEKLCTRHRATKYHCNKCGKEVNKNNKSGMCESCKKEYNLIPLYCSNCQKLFYRNQIKIISQIKQHGKRDHFFCCRKCQGEWVARKYGFGVHPENICYHIEGKTGSKYAPLFKEINYRLENGESMHSILKHFAISRGHYYLKKMAQDSQKEK